MNGQLLRMPRPKGVYIVIGLVVLVFLAWWIVSGQVVYISNAYVFGHEVDVAPQVSGPVVRVLVRDNQQVSAGTPLFQVEPGPYQRKLDETQARLRQSQAQEQRLRAELGLAQAEVGLVEAQAREAKKRQGRYQALAGLDAIAREQLDEVNLAATVSRANTAKAQAALTSAKAALVAQQAATVSAQAELKAAAYDLQQTVVRAPVAGTIVHLRLWQGNSVMAGKPAMALIQQSGHDWGWIAANVPESDIPALRSGMSVIVRLDMYPYHLFDGTVDSSTLAISRTPGTDKLVPYIDPTEQWIRFERRYPVLIRIKLDPKYPLYTGSNARVWIRRP